MAMNVSVVAGFGEAGPYCIAGTNGPGYSFIRGQPPQIQMISSDLRCF